MNKEEIEIEKIQNEFITGKISLKTFEIKVRNVMNKTEQNFIKKKRSKLSLKNLKSIFKRNL